MNRKTLILISDILQNLDKNTDDLFSMLDNLNITEEEKDKIIDSITLINNKLIAIRQSKISELGNHVDIHYLDTIGGNL